MLDSGQNILLCTLGMSWPVVAESYALLAPQRLPLYRNHPQKQAIDGIRADYGLAEPDELWLCTTDRTAPMLKSVQTWWTALGQPCLLRIWIAEDSGDLADAHQVQRMRELTLRVALHAAEHCASGQLVLSLAGGRKTMSADLQRAGQLFGHTAMLHIVGPAGPLPDILKGDKPKQLAQPLSAEDAAYVMPVILGKAARSELLDVTLDDRHGPIESGRFPLPFATAGALRVAARLLTEAALDKELQARERAGASLFGNFIRAIDEQAAHGNWRSLYRLPPRIVATLKTAPLDEHSRAWLTQLPKAELHCHLGGMLDLHAQRGVANALWPALSDSECDAAWKTVGDWIKTTDWPADWPTRLRAQPAIRHACAAALLLHSDETTLQKHLLRASEPRVALKNTHRLGFAAYELPGELSGSALLQHEAAIEPYARAVVTIAKTQGLRYLELRGSPQKYLSGRGADFLRLFATALNEHSKDGKLTCRFIIIIDRRAVCQAAEVVKFAVNMQAELPDFIAGLDLAGAEGTTHPEQLAASFEPAFTECLPLTIHAGEGEPAVNIWEAAYRLHADRIGHGLTLADEPSLLRRFRDRGVCIELCPTSNREVVGFYDPLLSSTQGLPTYPLADLLAKGLRVTLCTDNPGISRTSLADEYICAARMIAKRQQLTRWDALILIRQAFKSAFLPSDQRMCLMKAVDYEIFDFLNSSPSSPH